MPIDYSITYQTLGFYPVTDEQAAAVVAAFASNIGGWDQIRQLPLGVLDGVMVNGSYYSFSLEGDKSPNGIVYIYVYSMQDPNSIQSVGRLQQIQDDLAAANQNSGGSFQLPDLAGPLQSWGAAVFIGVLLLAALFVYLMVRK